MYLVNLFKNEFFLAFYQRFGDLQSYEMLLFLKTFILEVIRNI